jgi:hypothetical protein
MYMLISSLSLGQLKSTKAKHYSVCSIIDENLYTTHILVKKQKTHDNLPKAFRWVKIGGLKFKGNMGIKWINAFIF